MSNIRGIGSDRTTFNEKQEVGSFKIGVLKKNIELRNNILKRNIGRYEKFDQYMNPSIGEVENVYSNENNLPTIVGDLLQYTHGYNESKTNLKKELDDRYGDIFKYYYYTNPSFNAESRTWKGKYTNYVDYMAEVHGIEGYHDGKFTLGDAYDAVVDILKYTDASYMAKDMAVDVVRNVNVPAAILGVITTNVENMSGMDTKLGIITNAMYSNTLYNASLVNDSRKRQYITPELDSYIGNTWKTVGSLSDLFPILKVDGRTGDVFTENEFNNNLETNTTDVATYNEIQVALNNNDSIYTVENFQSGLRYINLERLNNDISPYSPYVGSLKYADNLKKGKSINTIGKTFKKLGSTFGGNAIVGGGVEIETEGDSLFTSAPEASSKRIIKGYIGEGFQIDRSFHGYTTSLDFDIDFEPKKEDDLLLKTNKLFHDGSIKSLISRYRNPEDTEMSLIQTSVSNFGISRGRNLLRKDAVIGSNKNPYCRVWTMFHQYNQYNDMIRGGGEFSITKQQDILESNGQRTNKGWLVNSVLNDNNTVQISPYKDMQFQDVYTKSKYESGTTKGLIKTEAHMHKYMFSIENLAWKDSDQFIDNLTSSQRGPNGGRIMWFPPYNLTFTENITPDWESHAFIGRGEKIYTYKDTERSGTLSFTMLIDHPSMVDLWAHENGDKTSDTDEMDLLRYFAGCGNLPINIRLTDEVTECEIPEEKLEVSIVEEEIQEPSIEETPINPISCSLEFYVFFPNNFSGKDFYKKSSVKNNMTIRYKSNRPVSYEDDCSVIEPINYLLTARGTITGGSGYEMTDKGLDTAGSNVIQVGKIGDEKLNDRWHYRVDCDVAHETLKYTENYKDTAGFQLNKDIERVRQYASGIMKNSESDNESNKYVISLNDMNIILNGTPNDSVLARIKEMLLSPDTKISKMEIKGFASSHGYTENNKKLAQYRGQSVYKWLKSSIIGTLIPDNVTIEDDEVKVDSIDKTNVSGSSAKAARSARVYMEFETLPTKAENNQTDSKTEFNASKNEVADTNTPKLNLNKAGDGVRKEYSFDEGDSVLRWSGEYDGKQTYVDDNLNTYYLDGVTGTFKLLEKSENNMGNDKPKCVTKTVRKPFKDVSSAQNEYKYFENIAKQQTPLYHKITEKIKYFDPAFHSLTPEGFNARLNFLHQCTRQGPTCGASDTKGFSAGNLSFGRPPFCVLRIGDFYHTKIIINSITINYDENTWDLNPEGAGVQPMMANIDINFIFLGGSDLSGPINKLQNAVSFNYYANTSVYDDRADTFVKQEYEPIVDEITNEKTKETKTIARKDIKGNQLYKKQ